MVIEKPVFILGFLNFDLRHLEPDKACSDQFIHKFSLREDSTHEQMSRALRFAFLKNARNFKALGVPIETNAKTTGPTEEQVRAL